MFQDDQINGQGKLLYHNTNYQYVGEFSNNEIKGLGKKNYIDGEFQGISVEGYFDDVGTKGPITVIKDKSKYVGLIEENEMGLLLGFMKDKLQSKFKGRVVN